MFDKDPCLVMSDSPHSPHSIILNQISPSAKILDIGCNTGFIGKSLLGKKVVSDGIDINTSALKIAQKSYRHVYKRDLYTGKLSLPKKTYDYVLLIDILEHLPRPDLILKDLKRYLNRNSIVIISLPNIARFEIRLKLLLGKFDYTDAGIISEDHLRFFTKQSAVKMIGECGYKINDVIPTGLGHMFKLFDTLTAFQFIYICRLTDKKESGKNPV